MVAEDAGFGVGRHEDGAQGFNSGRIGRHEFFPQLSLAGLYVEAVDSRRRGSPPPTGYRYPF
jgi:hypothetical protein